MGEAKQTDRTALRESSREYGARRFVRLIDWRAAVIAGVIAGTIFLVLNLLLVPVKIGGTMQLVFRYFASIIMGSEVVDPGYPFGAGIMIVAILVHYALSILFSLLVAIVLHRWGIIVGALGGGLLGLILYLINLYSLTALFPWFFAMTGELFLTIHIIFGAVVGTLYEVIERDEVEELQGEHEGQLVT